MLEAPSRRAPAAVSRVSKRGTNSMCSITSSGIPSSRSARPRSWRSGGSASGERSGQLGSASVRRLSIADREAGGVRGAGELVDQLVDALRARVGQVEGLAVQAGLVRDVVERARHPIDRHDVGVAEVEAHQRQPLRQQLAQRAGSP